MLNQMERRNTLFYIKSMEEKLKVSRAHLLGNNIESLQLDFDEITELAQKALAEVTPLEKEK